MLIPSSDLPVDPERLKKAIKTALIKNENNAEKIDIQSIMRDQVRIHKHIEEYKKSLSKQKVKGVNYVSSHIVHKIAEDTIHKSLKQIKNAQMNSIIMPVDPKTMKSSASSVDTYQKSPSKF